MISTSAWFFMLARFVFGIAFGLNDVFFNFYLKAMEYDATSIGLVNAIRVVGAASIFFAIRLIDRIGRRRVMLIGATLSTVGWLLTFSVQALPVMLASQVLRGVGDVLFSTVVVPMMAELSKGEERTALFSTSEGLSLLGLFLGGWLSGPLSEWLWSTYALQAKSASAYQGILLLANAIRLVGILPLLMVRPEESSSQPDVNPSQSEGEKVMSYFDPEVLFKISPHIFWLLLPWTLVYMGGGLVATTWNLYFEHTFGASEAEIGRVLGTLHLVDGIVTLGAALVATWIGARRLVILCAACSALLLVSLMFAPSFVVATGIIIVRAGIVNMIGPVFRAYVIDQSKRAEYTAVAVMLSATVNIGQFGSPILSGRLQPQSGNYTFVLPLAALLFVVATFAFWRIVGRERELKPLFE